MLQICEIQVPALFSPCLPLLPPSLERARVELEKIQKVGQKNKYIKQLACTSEKKIYYNFLSLGKVHQDVCTIMSAWRKQTQVLTTSSNKRNKKQQVNLTSSKHTVKLRHSLSQDAIGHRSPAHVQSVTEHTPEEKTIKGSEDIASLPQ